jgi:hypothetical protein
MPADLFRWSVLECCAAVRLDWTGVSSAIDDAHVACRAGDYDRPCAVFRCAAESFEEFSLPYSCLRWWAAYVMVDEEHPS